jgi:hypothetical protein
MGSILALGYVAFLMWPRWPTAGSDATPPSLPITVAGVLFNVPPAAIREPAQRQPGTQPRLDLAFHWPDLTPPPLGTKPRLANDLSQEHLFVTIAAAQGTLPLMERIRTIYPRYVANTAFAGPSGLTGVAFRDGTPYQGEDLFLDGERPERFVARCTRETRLVIGMCLLERSAGAAEITLRFPRAWLEQWTEISSSADRLIAQLRSSTP